ncbi:FAD-binding oxidoreductase [Mesorhizobium sp. CAU 1732]|uniref:NAD(P)/FAD-dependent oxidoreductase n=1 Tax=Mesorhizobium sp. CAU 1732 TaxID=3140358 RepID=UPI003260D75E
MIRKLDLRTGRPVWFSYRAPAVPTSKLSRDVKTDVLVVGMGISGAMIVEALTASGHSVIAIDRRGPLKGSTPASTALVQYEIDQPLTTLSNLIGKEKAVRAWRRSRLAVANLGAHIDRLGIACNKAPRPSIYVAGNVMGISDLRAEAQARRAAGVHADYLTASELEKGYRIKGDGAIISEDNIALDPRKLTAGLLNIAAARGARFYAPVEATEFEHASDAVTVATKDGPTITAGHVVLATGYELAAVVAEAKHSVISTWAIATAPQKRNLWPREAFVWEASDPYLYMRTTADGRVICGGEDEEFSDEDARDELIAEKAARISEKLAKRMPGIDTKAELTWAGSFGTTATGLPHISRIPRRPRITAVMGYGGNGITYSRVAAEIIRTDLDGGKDTDADLFAMS